MAKQRVAIIIQTAGPENGESGVDTFTRAWATSAVKRLKDRRRYRVITIRDADATRATVERVLTRVRNRRGILVFYGRGCDCGGSLLQSKRSAKERWMPLVDGANASLLRNKIVYVVACHSAKCLAGYARKNGAIAYIGYVDKVSPGITGSVPDAGHVRRGFTECMNAGLRILTERAGTCAEARNAIHDELTRWIHIFIRKRSIKNAWAMMVCRGALVPSPIGAQQARL